MDHGAVGLADLLRDKPRGLWPWLWLTYGLLFLAGWAAASIIGGPIAWAAFLGGAFFGFWLVEGPALANRSGGDTLTEHLQYIFGASGLPWLAVVTWAIVTALLYLQVGDLVAYGIPERAAQTAWIAFTAWTFKHFLWRDSRLWQWAAHRRAARKEENDADTE